MDKKIFLVADDDIDDREMFEEALAMLDPAIVCLCATDGRDVITILQDLETLPQLIFLDVNMPVMNGWQCLKLLKSEERYQHIPVIVISTSSHPRDIDIAAELGALCYLTKPNDFGELTQVLEVIIANPGKELVEALDQLKDNIAPFLFACNKG